MSIASFSVRQPVLVNLLAIFIVLGGGLALQSMHRESSPIMPTGWATITTIYPGASPEEVEQLVSVPIENAIANVDEIDEIWSASRESRSSVFVKFEPDVVDVSRKVMEITNEVNQVRDLPADAEAPSVREFKFDYPTLAIAIEGDVPTEVLRQVATSIANEVERINGVAALDKIGIPDREIRVSVNPTRLASYRLPLSIVAEALLARQNNVAAGTIEGDADARLVRGMTQANTAEQVGAVVIRPSMDGGSVRIDDVAEVHEGFSNSGITGEVNGQTGAVLTVKKEEQADSIRISEDVRRVIDRMQKNLPPGVQINIFGDASHEVNRSLDTLYVNALVGLFLVIALLWIFIGARNAMMAALGLPVALAGAIIVMSALGITINMVSLLALILCLGVVVDDAIIIIENIYRYMELGVPRREAAIRGTNEVFWPVVSSTLTTWAAFLPLLMMTGTLGLFFAIIPKVVIAALGASLVEAMFVLPSHMAEHGKISKSYHVEDGTELDKAHPPRSPFVARMIDRYLAWLKRALVHRKAVVFGTYFACAALMAAVVMFKDVVLFAEGDVETIDVRVRMPTDSSKEHTDDILREIDQRLQTLNNSDLEATVAVRGMVRTDMGVELGDHVGMVTAFIVPVENRSSERAGTALLDQTAHLFDDIVGPTSLQVIPFRPGPPRGAPIAVRISGENLDQLVDLAEVTLGEIREVPGTRDASVDFQLGKREAQVHIDEDRAAMHAMTAPMVASWLRYTFGGAPAATSRRGDDEIDIYVELDKAFRNDPTALESLTLISPSGDEVALSDVATVGHGRGPGAIRRYQRDRVVTVTANIDDDITNSQAVNEALKKRLATTELANPGVMFQYGGQFEETNESVDSLKRAFILAALLIYTILATQFQSFFQPLIVMAAIPLGLVGVALGFLLSAKPIGLISLVGMVGLTGIVVNDSLVLVDFINKRRTMGLSIDDAIVEACRLRLRPIFLTSITTVAGLFPLAITYESTPLLAPMAAVVCWGLTFATFLTLVVVPCLYRMMAKGWALPEAATVTEPDNAD
ncbi:MAG: efflux RND transporter permease subunit [Polyangiales bacterium]